LKNEPFNGKKIKDEIKINIPPEKGISSLLLKKDLWLEFFFGSINNFFEIRNLFIIKKIININANISI
jgi:hypothetical protein